jgi:hypothetical protein
MAQTAPQRMTNSAKATPRTFSIEALRNDFLSTFRKRGILGWGNTAWPAGKPIALRHHIARLIPGDATRADIMYADRFGRSPKTKLAELGWLKHFDASGKALHALYAIDLLKLWSQEELSALRGAEAAKALLALISDGYNLAAKGPKTFLSHYFRMTETLARRVYAWRPSPGPDSLLRANALAYALTTIQGFEGLRPRVKDAFDAALPQTILPDGGHVDGNPESLLKVLLQLLPLRGAMLRVREPIPASLNASIDRMLPMLRMLLRGESGFAAVRGARPNAEAIALCLQHDETQGQPLTIAPHSGYARIAAAKSLIVADTTPLNGFTLDLSVDGHNLITTAHKNTLSFRRFSTESPAEIVEFEDGVLLVTGVRIGGASFSRHLFTSSEGADIRIEDIATGHDEPFENIITLANGAAFEPSDDPHTVTVKLPSHSIWEIKMRGGEMRIEHGEGATRLIMTAKQEDSTASLTWAIKKQV